MVYRSLPQSQAPSDQSVLNFVVSIWTQDPRCRIGTTVTSQDSLGELHFRCPRLDLPTSFKVIQKTRTADTELADQFSSGRGLVEVSAYPSCDTVIGRG